MKEASYRGALVRINRVARLSRPDISFSVFTESTKFKQANPET